MELGQKFLVLRFGTNIKKDCIEEHLNVLQEHGSCWFGKIGVVPSKKAIDITLGMEQPRILLYTKSHAYECDFEEVTYEKPIGNYPKYYEEELFEKGIVPKSYYKLTSIREVDLRELGNYVVVSSRNRLMDTLNKSMSSYFFAEYPDKNQVNKIAKNITGKIDTNEQNQMLPVNDCRYRKDGICSSKSCINYKYECERPNMCIKQKR